MLGRKPIVTSSILFYVFFVSTYPLRGRKPFRPVTGWRSSGGLNISPCGDENRRLLRWGSCDGVSTYPHAGTKTRRIRWSRSGPRLNISPCGDENISTLCKSCPVYVSTYPHAGTKTLGLDAFSSALTSQHIPMRGRKRFFQRHHPRLLRFRLNIPPHGDESILH